MQNRRVRSALLALFAAIVSCNETPLKGTSKKLHPTIEKDFTQDDYPAATSTRLQGNQGDPGLQNFDQGEWGPLDVLVVIDNSGSMAQEQANLSTKLEALLSQVDKANWRIAVVTTDPSDSCQRALINKGDADAKTRFSNAVNAGTQGDGLERPFLQAVNGLKCRGGAWLRPNSALAVLIVTDEDNCSINDEAGYGCDGEADLNGSFLTDQLASIRTIGKDAKVYGLYRKPQDPTCTTALVDATKVDAVVTQTGGKAGSICDADYTTTLKAISEDVAQILKYEFDLQDVPDPGTLAITVDGAAWTKFALEGKHVRFTDVPPFGSKVAVSYKHGKQGTLDAGFTVDKKPVPGSFKVLVNGQEVPPSDYSWNEATQKLEFKTPPPERANIQIAYQEDVPLKNQFEISKEADPSTLRAAADDNPLKVTAYDAKTGMVTVEPAPPAKAHVVISYKEKL